MEAGMVVAAWVATSVSVRLLVAGSLIGSRYPRVLQRQGYLSWILISLVVVLVYFQGMLPGRVHDFSLLLQLIVYWLLGACGSLIVGWLFNPRVRASLGDWRWRAEERSHDGGEESDRGLDTTQTPELGHEASLKVLIFLVVFLLAVSAWVVYLISRV